MVVNCAWKEYTVTDQRTNILFPKTHFKAGGGLYIIKTQGENKFDLLLNLILPDVSTTSTPLKTKNVHKNSKLQFNLS